MVSSSSAEGCSLRSTARMTGVDRETVGTTLARVGAGCLGSTAKNRRLVPAVASLQA